MKRRGGAIWISGAPGSGKTTLVASWLAARRHPASWLRVDAADEDLATFLHFLAEAMRPRGSRGRRLPLLAPGLDPEVFARRFFRILFAGMRKGAVLVLDDLGEVSEQAPLQMVFRVMLDELPGGAMLVLSSRGEPPAALAAARADGRVSVVLGGDLELDAREVRALARRHGFGGGKREAEALGRAVSGWAAGLVILLADERSRRVPEHAGRAALDYFAGEVFERADEKTRRVLLETALLDSPRASLAARATGDPATPRVLATLARRGVFTLRHGTDDPAFEFHALFRAFLLRRGREELPPGRADEVRRAAAEALAERGGDDADAAFGLFVEAGAFDRAAALAARTAPALLAEGRGAMVKAWLRRLPPDLRDSNPWLLYFGAVSSLGRDPERARERLDRAAALFAEREDAAGFWLAWAAAVEAVFLAGTDFTVLSGRLEALASLEARFPIPSEEVRTRVTLAKLVAFAQHAPGHSALRAAAADARALALGPGDNRDRLTAGAGYVLVAGWWYGDGEGIRPLVAALGPIARKAAADPVASTAWLTFEAFSHILAGDEAAAARTAGEARELCHRLGVRLWDAALVAQSIWGALVRDDVAAARDAIGRLGAVGRPGNPYDLTMLRAFQAAVALRDGAFSEAIRLGEEIKEVGERMGHANAHVFADLVLARAYERSGAQADADAACASARRKLDTIHTPTFENLLALIEADRALRAAQDEEARHALARAAATARAGAVHARYMFSANELAALWAAALRRGIASEQVRALVRARAYPAPPDAGEEWPWPARIWALGTFEVERGGEVISRRPRAPRKPLELLRVLVAAGGSDVPEGVVADALWPDAEADAAQHALETTVYRLRRMIGADVVIQRDRKLSLARGRCWVDARELEALLAAGIEALARGGAVGGADQAERIAALYRGPLFADASDAPWAVDGRERLRRKLARWLEAIARTRSSPEPTDLGSRLAAVDPALKPRSTLRIA